MLSRQHGKWKGAVQVTLPPGVLAVTLSSVSPRQDISLNSKSSLMSLFKNSGVQLWKVQDSSKHSRNDNGYYLF